MKYSELNDKQKKAFKNIKYCTDWLIGGFENSIEDGDDEDGFCEAQLKNHEGLVNMVYEESLTTIYGVGSCNSGKWAEEYLKDIRFCGKEFLMSVAEHFVKKSGY